MFILFFLRYLEKPGMLSILTLSISYSYLMLIKPHALFQAVPLLAYFIFRAAKLGVSLKRTFIDFSVIIVLALLIRSIVGFLLAGPQGLVILGNGYSSVATNPALDLLTYSAWYLILTSLQGHLISILFLFGPVFILVFYELKRREFKDNIDKSYSGVLVFGFFSVSTMVIVSSVFTAEVVLINGESLFRIHQRYYSFLFPFFILYAIRYLKSSTEFKENKLVKFVILPSILLTVLYTISQIPRIYNPNFIDSPAISSVARESNFRILYAFILITFLLIFARNTGMLGRFFLFFQIPFIVFMGTTHIGSNLSGYGQDTVYEKGAHFAVSEIGFENLDELLVIGSYSGNLMRVPFELNSSEITLQTWDSKNAFSLANLRQGVNWVLVFDSTPIDHQGAQFTEGEGFRLFKLGSKQ
jgi:phosphoglycerol transferase